VQLVTDGGGNAAFSEALPLGPTARFVTATATDPAAIPPSFSDCVGDTGAGDPDETPTETITATETHHHTYGHSHAHRHPDARADRDNRRSP